MHVTQCQYLLRRVDVCGLGHHFPFVTDDLRTDLTLVLICTKALQRSMPQKNTLSPFSSNKFIIAQTGGNLMVCGGTVHLHFATFLRKLLVLGSATLPSSGQGTHCVQ